MRGPRPRALTNDQVAAVLLAPATVTSVALAARFGVGEQTIYMARRRKTKQALRIAHRLKIPLSPQMGWRGKEGVRDIVRPGLV